MSTEPTPCSTHCNRSPQPGDTCYMAPDVLCLTAHPRGHFEGGLSWIDRFAPKRRLEPPPAKISTAVQIMVRQWQDALSQATPEYWDRLAQQLEEAAPRPDEYHGQATDDELRERWINCMTTASACRRHASILRDNLPEDVTDEVWDALAEVA